MACDLGMRVLSVQIRIILYGKGVRALYIRHFDEIKQSTLDKLQLTTTIHDF